LPLVVKANEARNLRIQTSKLNRFFEDNVSQPRGGTAPSPNKGGGSRLKVQFITQGGLRPPLFILFTSGGGPSKAGLHFSYLRYIENRLREEFDFFATPIRLKERHKTKDKRE
jgi:GTP-binding protein